MGYMPNIKQPFLIKYFQVSLLFLTILNKTKLGRYFDGLSYLQTTVRNMVDIWYIFIFEHLIEGQSGPAF